MAKSCLSEFSMNNHTYNWLQLNDFSFIADGSGVDVGQHDNAISNWGNNIFAIETGSQAWEYTIDNTDVATLKKTFINGVYSFNLKVNDTTIADVGIHSQYLYSNVEYFCIIVDDALNQGWLVVRHFENGHMYCTGGDNAVGSEIYNTFVTTHYTWQSVPSISGKNGILSLSVIKDELLGDLTGGTWQSVSEVMDVLSPNSRLYKYWNNLALNQEVTICYSGPNHFLNIKRDSASTCQLKFYSHEEMMIYSVGVNMQTLGRDPYLCFVIEEEQNFAQPIITYTLDVQGQQQLTWSKIYPDISTSEMYALYAWLQYTEDYTPNPYSQGSESNGGEDFNLTPQDDFGDELPPDITGLDCGFFTVYVPTAAQLQSLSSFLWSDDIIYNIKKYFGNVSDSIISLYMLPYKPSGLSSKKFQVGDIVLDDGPSVEFLSGQRYVDIDMGSFSIDPTFNSYLDYEPFTRLSIYLPFIGVQQLPTDEFMTKADPSGALSDKSGSTITVKYRIDLLTGGCVAYIKQGTQNKLQFSGKCGATLPISGANYNNMISGLVQAVGGLASTIASGGLTAPLSFGAAISGTVSAMKPDLYKAGNLSGELSLLSYNRPMIIKTRPNIHKDMSEQIDVDGLPSYKVKTIGDYNGYISCVAVHVDGINCTDAEKEKIHSLLLEGVIV